MKEEQILNHLKEYYLIETSDVEDLEIVINQLNELGSLSYFYHITKLFELELASNESINKDQFQMILTKWFHACVENLTFIVP